MTTQEYAGDQVYQCPNCDGSLTFVQRSWRCHDCGHVPNHAAD